MSEKTTKIITTVFSILLLLVILGATASLFCCNLFTIHLPDAKFDSRFLTGKYTKSLKISQVDYNIVSLLKQIPNFTYAGFVIDYQAYDAEIKEYEGEIVNYREYYNNATAENDKNRYQNKIDDLSAKVDFVKEKQTLLVNGMSNEDMALLSELLADADFVNLLGMYYIMGSGSALFLGDTLTGINNNTNREWGSFFLGMVFAPICVILFACFVLMIVILAIVFAIQAISDTVKCLRRIGNADHSLVKSMQNKLLYYSLSISMIFILPLKLCMGTTFAIGKAYLWMFILYLVSRAVITVYNMLTSDEKHAILFVKQTLALISAVMLVIAAFAILNSGFISHVLADADAFGNAYSSNYVITGGNTSLVEKETSAVVTKADAIVTMLFLILGIFVLYLAFVAILI